MKKITLLLFTLFFFGNIISNGQIIITDESNNPIEGFGLVKDPKSNIVFFGKIDSLTSTAIYTGILKDEKISAIRKSVLIDNNSQETIPLFSSDGKYVFVFSNVGNKTPKNLDLWFGEHNGKGVVHNFKRATEINTDSVEYYGSMSGGDDLYFSSWRKDGYGKGDIFSTKFKNGKFSAIEHLDDNINTKFINSSPAISPKGDWIIFFNENENVADLYISFLSSRKWSKPIKLSNLVNTSNFEFAPVVADDGKTLYFSRREKSTLNDKQVYHIYKVAIDELELTKLEGKAEY